MGKTGLKLSYEEREEGIEGLVFSSSGEILDVQVGLQIDG